MLKNTLNRLLIVAAGLFGIYAWFCFRASLLIGLFTLGYAAANDRWLELLPFYGKCFAIAFLVRFVDERLSRFAERRAVL
jgi:hypothetical protein